MSANVETMMYVREKPWHGLGTEVAEAPASADALRFAGLDWTVRQEPVYNSRGGIIKGYKSNVRDSDGSVLGIVGDRYKVVQNIDAFNFTDDLIGGDVRYETAGSLREGKQIWLLAKMPERRIAGDAVEPFLCFTNSHDGGSGVKVCMTPIRVVCNNTLNLALSSAKRSWSLRHTENVHERLDEARDCLFRADRYMDGLEEYADTAADRRLRDDEISAILNELFPISEQATERETANVNKCKDEFWVCYFSPDLLKFRGTAWGAINAMSDMVTHSMPHRNTKNYAENNWGRIMDGHPLLDRMVDLVG
jgi:phage/plasmid-like protein (TIGR03299 family)